MMSSEQIAVRHHIFEIRYTCCTILYHLCKEVDIMLFQVFNAAGSCVMCTEQASCVPYDKLEAMHRAGHKFKVDGKLVSTLNVLDAVNMSVSSNCLNTATYRDKNNYTKYVRCIDTGKVYRTQSEAARDLGIDPAQVSDSIKTGRPRSGYRFERVLEGENYDQS